MIQNKPYIIDGNIARDVRGSLSFFNGFDMRSIKRFYQVSTVDTKMIRAWHGHMREIKYTYVIKGKALMCTVKLSDTVKPSKRTTVKRFILSEKKSAILCIPAGYANGFQSLEKSTQIIFFSSSTLAQSKKDDYRFDPEYFGDVWRGNT